MFVLCMSGVSSFCRSGVTSLFWYNGPAECWDTSLGVKVEYLALIRVLRFGGGSLSGGVLGPLGAQVPWNDSSRVRGGPWAPPPRVENSLQKFCSVNCLWLLSSPLRWLVFFRGKLWCSEERRFLFSKCALKVSPHTVQFCVLSPLPLRETDQANRH